VLAEYKRDTISLVFESINHILKPSKAPSLNISISPPFESLQAENKSPKMISMSNIAFVASSLIGLATAAPAVAERQTFIPGKLNNTRVFYIKMTVTDDDRK
jgi:hypothetical protein